MKKNETGIKNPESDIHQLQISKPSQVYWNLKPNALIDQSLRRNMGTLSYNGTLTIKTGKFTGRSPKDRFIVKDAITENTVDWNDINQAIDSKSYDQLFKKLTQYFSGKDIFIKDGTLCRDDDHALDVRVVCEYPWSANFVHNMFNRPDNEKLQNFTPEWTVYCAPGFKADSKSDKTRQENFSIINFSKKQVLIGGTAYTGEIKKAMFSVLNYTLPLEKGILSMHCSANVGTKGDTAVFFGLSGTGKTTLSADPDRKLIGDDEHGWSDEGLFNFEGGCYAKCINLSAENEPDIYKAIRPGAILENICFHPGTSRPDYSNTSITENTRVSYPLHYIDHYFEESRAAHPKNIFFLCCDAFGILPPISKLSREQAMFYFISGYTAKVAGTEDGINEPLATFSACFGAPFLPLHPNTYAGILGKKIDRHDVNIWLVNTGWIGGAYGTGERISLKYTRRMVSAALNNEFDKVSFTNFAVFNLKIPSFCEGIHGEILHPRNSWADKEAYNSERMQLASMFVDNMKKFEDKLSSDILNAAPKISVPSAV
jgi:phosphoenolpyruvate carboxykinase (ATP)